MDARGCEEGRTLHDGGRVGVRNVIIVNGGGGGGGSGRKGGGGGTSLLDNRRRVGAAAASDAARPAGELDGTNHDHFHTCRQPTN